MRFECDSTNFHLVEGVFTLPLLSHIPPVFVYLSRLVPLSVHVGPGGAHWYHRSALVWLEASVL